VVDGVRSINRDPEGDVVTDGASSAQVGLFPRVLGTDWERLPPTVRRLHGGQLAYARGVACVRGDLHWRARLVRAIARLPSPSEAVALALEIHADATGERWLRRFAQHPMRSCLAASRRFANTLEERLGRLRLSFGFEVVDARLHWIAREVQVLGIALPLRWFRGMRASCGEQQGRYAFDIDVSLPLVGRLVAYSGWLEPVDDAG
jgi:hypothetical protein